MAGAAAVDQERGAGGAHAGVAQRLEEGLHLGREVGHVHVVDDVVGGAEEAERARGLERRAVLDVAPLDPVVPVHPADAVAVRGRRRWRSPSVQTGVTEGKAETQSRISSPRSSSAPKFGALPAATVSSSLSVRSESTKTRQSLRWPLAHRSERSPSYFSPAARRRVANRYSVARSAGIEISATGPSRQRPASASA